MGSGSDAIALLFVGVMILAISIALDFKGDIVIGIVFAAGGIVLWRARSGGR